MTYKCTRCGTTWGDSEPHSCNALRSMMLDRLAESVRHASVGDLLVIVEYDPDPEPPNEPKGSTEWGHYDAGDIYETLIFNERGMVLDSCSGLYGSPDHALDYGVEMLKNRAAITAQWGENL